MVFGCPKKPEPDVRIPERELPEELEEFLDELEEDNFDDLPEDTGNDEN
jgi:hypothetical protein